MKHSVINQSEMRYKCKIMTAALLLSAAGGRADNPILRYADDGFLYAADPAAEVYDGTVYVYCSRDVSNATSYATMQDYMILSSSDMTNWVNHGVVLEPRTQTGFEYASGQMNAPDAAYKDGWYYWYFPYNKTYVGVAKSTSPTGPWESAVTNAITTIFDPTVFVDDDGQAYIYGSDNKVNIGDAGAHVMGAKLHENMIELDSEWFRLSAETVSEAVHVFKRNGIYYFTARKGSPTAYWMADEPLPSPDNPDSAGSYASYQGTLAGDAADAPNHTSAIEFNGRWWLFYHRGDVNQGSYNRRSACFDEMIFNADGTIQEIVYTVDESAYNYEEEVLSVGERRQEFEEYSDVFSNIVVESCSDTDGGDQLGYIENGSWSAYTNINFGTNPTGSVPFYVRASSKTSGGTVSLHLDSLSADPIGTIDISGTTSWTVYETFSNTLSGVSGTHTLYLQYTGGDGFLFNLNWLEWTPFDDSVDPSDFILVDFGATDGGNGTTAEGDLVWNGIEPGVSGADMTAGGTNSYAGLMDGAGDSTGIGLSLFWSAAAGLDFSRPWDLHDGDRDGDYLGIRGDNAGVYNRAVFTGLTPGSEYTVTAWTQAETDFRVNGGEVTVVSGVQNASESNDALSGTFTSMTADAAGEVTIDWGHITSERGDNQWASVTALSIELTAEAESEAVFTEYAISNGLFRAQCSAEAGQRCRLDYIEDLMSSNGWQTVTDITVQAESPIDVSAAATNETGFYRIILIE